MSEFVRCLLAWRRDARRRGLGDDGAWGLLVDAGYVEAFSQQGRDWPAFYARAELPLSAWIPDPPVPLP